MKLSINGNKVFVLPEPDGPIINILNGQSSFSEKPFFLLLTISSKFNILYVQRIIFDVIIPTDHFEYFLMLLFPPIPLNIF